MDPIKGFGAGLHIVDKVAGLSSSSTRMVGAGCPGGTIVHLHSDGAFAPGAVGTQMPMVLYQWTTDPDVSNTGGGTDWFNATPTGKASALVAIGGFEIDTTEFYSGDTYTYNDPLHAPVEAQTTNDLEAGRLYKNRKWGGGNTNAIAAYTDHICGIVSLPARRNHNKVWVLRFWPYFLPGATSST